jgi:cytochrome d ubiquinol oxidase subunit I
LGDGRGQPLTLFGWPNMAIERNYYALDIPKLGSLILTHDLDGEVKGLKAGPPAERRGIGLALTAIALFGAFLRWRGWLYDRRERMDRDRSPMSSTGISGPRTQSRRWLSRR